MSTLPVANVTPNNNNNTSMELYPPPHITIKDESPTMMVTETSQETESVRRGEREREMKGVFD